jgi:hypothetical protein
MLILIVATKFLESITNGVLSSGNDDLHIWIFKYFVWSSITNDIELLDGYYEHSLTYPHDDVILYSSDFLHPGKSKSLIFIVKIFW